MSNLNVSCRKYWIQSETGFISPDDFWDGGLTGLFVHLVSPPASCDTALNCHWALLAWFSRVSAVLNLGYVTLLLEFGRWGEERFESLQIQFSRVFCKMPWIYCLVSSINQDSFACFFYFSFCHFVCFCVWLYFIPPLPSLLESHFKQNKCHYIVNTSGFFWRKKKQ